MKIQLSKYYWGGTVGDIIFWFYKSISLVSTSRLSPQRRQRTLEEEGSLKDYILNSFVPVCVEGGALFP